MKGEFRVKTLHFVLTGEQLIVNLKPTVENGSLAFIKLILILIRWNSHDFIDFDILQICFSSVLSDNRFSMTTPVDVQRCMLTTLTFDDMKRILKFFINSCGRKHSSLLKCIEYIAF